MRSGIRARIAVTAVAAATGWTATWSWAGLVADSYRYIGPGLVAACIVGLVGAVVRSLHGRWYLALLAQVVIVLSWFGHRQHTGGLVGGWIPTPHSIERLADQVHAGAGQVDKYSAPVAAVHAQAPVYLLAVSILLILGVDLIAAGLQRAPWAGLPLIVALTVPISVLDSGLPPTVFVVTGLLYSALLAVAEADRIIGWGQAVTGERSREDDLTPAVAAASLSATGVRIAVVTAVGALVLPMLLPLGSGVFDSRHRGGGSGSGGSSTVRLKDPMVDLRRDLVSNLHIPLLDVTTDAARPTYLRLTVLDQFTGAAWVPSSRRLDVANGADGALPLPDGFSASTPGRESSWQLNTTASFATTWLPTPYVTRQISIQRGDWRYDATTLDIASAEADPPQGVGYVLRAFIPDFDATALDRAPGAPADVQDPMTRVPGLDDRVTRIAQQVTASGRTAYAKAVLLQDWFRSTGGFTYSLARQPGNGMAELVKFITVDKVGYCEQYAAAMAVMARALGIPARVVVGFLAPKKVGPDRYRYTSDDLHAWPEVYFRGSGWVRFEPTPSTRTGIPPSWTLGRLSAAPTSGPTSAPTQARPSPRPSSKTAEQSSSSRGNSQDTHQGVAVVVLIMLVLLALLIPALVRRGQRRRRLLAGPSDARNAAALWEELRATAIDLGLLWPEGRSERTTADALLRWGEPGPEDAAALGELVTLVERARYSREFAMDADEHAEAVRTTETWIRLLQGAVRPRRARVARVFPRSVLHRLRDEDVPVPELSEKR